MLEKFINEIRGNEMMVEFNDGFIYCNGRNEINFCKFDYSKGKYFSCSLADIKKVIENTCYIIYRYKNDCDIILDDWEEVSFANGEIMEDESI